MAADTTVTVRVDSALKSKADEICSEMGISISGAINIFLKRMVRDRAIPFRVEASQDNFYSEENTAHLKAAAARMDKGKFEIHPLEEN